MNSYLPPLARCELVFRRFLSPFVPSFTPLLAVRSALVGVPQLIPFSFILRRAFLSRFYRAGTFVRAVTHGLRRRRHSYPLSAVFFRVNFSSPLRQTAQVHTQQAFNFSQTRYLVRRSLAISVPWTPSPLGFSKDYGLVQSGPVPTPLLFFAIIIHKLRVL